MVWLTWRQHRIQVLVTAALLLGLGGFLLVHGVGTADVAARLASDGEALESALGDRFRPVDYVLGWLPLAPALIGLFWGAPVLAKEFERGTDKLVWTQSVSRRRWLAMKLGGLGAAVMLAGLAFGGMVNWWLTSFDGTRYADRFGNVGMFVVSGVLPAAWWLFAFAVGAAAGAVFQRTLPAIAVTLAVTMAAILSLFFFQVRDNYATPEREVQTSAAPYLGPGEAMVTDYRYLNPDGRELSSGELYAEIGDTCMSVGASFDYSACLFEHGYRDVVYSHPPSRYWRFQWTEAGFLLLGTLAMGGIAVRRVVRRRMS